MGEPSTSTPITSTENLIEVRNVSVELKINKKPVRIIDDVSFSLKAGETLGIVGESGCGKSITALAMMRLLPPKIIHKISGEIWFNGRNLLTLSDEEMRKVRGNEIGMIFQDPMTSFNPVETIGQQIDEALQIHRSLSSRAARARTVELLDLVGIPSAATRSDDYPHQFSGGMRQRAMIAMALSCDPKLLIADEPTTALDVTIQAQILELIGSLREEFGMAVMLITHDMGVVASMSDRINVMYSGRVVENGTADQVFFDTQHPYTNGLMNTIPRLDRPRMDRLVPIDGMPPNLLSLPSGCAFEARCAYSTSQCRSQKPMEQTKSNGHGVKCWVDTDFSIPPDQSRNTAEKLSETGL